MAAIARAVEALPPGLDQRQRGLFSPKALSGEGFRGIIRTAKDSLRTETTLSATDLLTSRPPSPAYWGRRL